MVDEKVGDKQSSSASQADAVNRSGPAADALKARLSGGTKAKGARGAARRALAGGQGDAGAPPIRRRIAMRLYRVLTRTPDDGSGMVPGTPFRQAGVARLMASLHERAADEGAPGANVATRAIEFIKPSKEGEDAIHGASVDKLQAFARMADEFQASKQ